MKWLIVIFLILFCSLVSAGTVVLGEGEVNEGLYVVKIFDDKVLVRMDGVETFLRVDKVVKGVTLTSINNNVIDDGFTRAVFNVAGVNEPEEVEVKTEVFSLAKNEAVDINGELVIFVKATDKVVFLSIDSKEKIVRKDEKFRIGGYEVSVVSLMHNVVDDRYDRIGLKVYGTEKKNKYMNKITGNVVGAKAVDYSGRTFNAVKKIPISGRLVDKSKEMGVKVGKGMGSESVSVSVPWWKKFLKLLLGGKYKE